MLMLVKEKEKANKLYINIKYNKLKILKLN